MSPAAWIAIVSVTVTILIVSVTALINLSYRHGHHAARIEALESWRGNVRNDMHEISDKLETIAGELKTLMTLVEERTERRYRTIGTIAPDDDRRSPGRR